MKNLNASLLIGVFLAFFCPSLHAELTREDIKEALKQTTEAKRTKAILALVKSKNTADFGDKNTKAMMTVLTEALLPRKVGRGDNANWEERSPEFENAVWELITKKMDLNPMKLLDNPEQSYVVLLTLFPKAKTPAELSYLLRNQLEPKRKGESTEAFQDRLFNALDAVDAYRADVLDKEDSPEKTARLAELEKALTNVMTEHTNPTVKSRAKKLLAAEQKNWKKEKVENRITLDTWKALAEKLPEIIESGKPQAIANHSRLLADHARLLKTDLETELGMENALTRLLTQAKDVETQAAALELLGELSLRNPVSFIHLHDEKLTGENAKLAKSLRQEMAAGPGLTADPKTLKQLEALILANLAKPKDLLMSVELARLIRTENPVVQAALFELSHRKSNGKPLQRALALTLKTLDAEGKIPYETEKLLKEREDRQELGFKVASDPLLVKAENSGAMKDYSAVLQSIQGANSYGLMELANEHKRRKTTNPEFLRAFLKRMFDPEITENARKLLAHQATPLLPFTPEMVDEIVQPHRDANGTMSEAASIFLEKYSGSKARYGEGPVIDLTKIAPEGDAEVARTGAKEGTPTPRKDCPFEKLRAAADQPSA